MPYYNRYKPRRSSPLAQPPWNQDDVPDPVYEEEEHTDEDTQQPASPPVPPQHPENPEQPQNPEYSSGNLKIPRNLRHLGYPVLRVLYRYPSQQREQGAASRDAAAIPPENEVPGLSISTSQDESSLERLESSSNTTELLPEDVNSRESVDTSSESDEDDDLTQSEYVLATTHTSQSAEGSADVSMTDAAPYVASNSNTPRTMWPGDDKGKSMDMLLEMSFPTVSDED